MVSKLIVNAVVIGSVVAIAVTSPVSAVSNSWTNDGYSTQDYKWSSTRNWTPGTPAINDTVIFDSTKSLELYTPSDNDTTGVKLNGITFTGSAENGYAIGENTLHLTNEIKDQNTGDSLNGITNNIYTYGDTKITTINNAGLINTGNTYLGSGNLYLRAYNNSFNYFSGSVNGASDKKVYVTGDKYGVVAISPEARITRPLVVKDKGDLYLSGRTTSLHITSSGLFTPLGCSYVRNLIMTGYQYPTIEGDPGCDTASKTYVVGTVNVTAGTLVTNFLLDPESVFEPTVGKGYILVSNDGSDKIVGTYRGLPEGSTFNAKSYEFKITYRGGTGNDIVITRVE